MSEVKKNKNVIQLNQFGSDNFFKDLYLNHQIEGISHLQFFTKKPQKQQVSRTVGLLSSKTVGKSPLKSS